MSESLHSRARKVRSQATIRAWEYRQRQHSKGVWFRLRRVLADAGSAFAIPADEAERLLGEGFLREPVGAEIEPQKVLVFVPSARLGQIPGKRQLRVAIDTEFLAAPFVVLCRFEDAGTPRQYSSRLGSD